MHSRMKYAKVNIKVLIVLIFLCVAIIVSLFAARQIRRKILTKLYLEAGNKAYDSEDWSAAYENYREYLGRNPNDLEILKKYAEARFSMRPLDNDIITGAVSAYRRILQLNKLDENAYDKLAIIYQNIENFEELDYISQKKLENIPADKKAKLWLADAQINLNKTDDAQRTLLNLIEDIESASDFCPEYIQACLFISNILTKK